MTALSLPALFHRALKDVSRATPLLTADGSTQVRCPRHGLWLLIHADGSGTRLLSSQ
jgi:hypothetical protein